MYLCIYLIFFRILPESPRWLLTKGKEEEAMEVIKYIGRVNNREFPDHLMVVIKVMLALSPYLHNTFNASYVFDYRSFFNLHCFRVL